MTIVLRRNPSCDLNRVEYSGSLTMSELAALAHFASDHPNVLSCDCLSLIEQDVDFERLDLKALEPIFKKYRSLFEPMHLVIIRRSAWVCLSQDVRGHLKYWLGERNTRKSISSDVREFETIAEACRWLMLDRAHAAMAENGDGFDEIARFHLPVRPAFAAAG